MRSADRRKAFFAVCMMAVLLFSHLGVCLWQTQIARVQNLTAEAGGEAQGILRTTDSDYVSNALSAEPEAGLSQSMIVVTRKMTGAAEQRLFFHLFTAVLFKIAEIPYAEAVVLTVTAACICLAGYRMVRFVHNSDGKKICPFGYHRYQKRHKIRIRKGKRRKWNIEIFLHCWAGLHSFCMECIR